MITILLTNGDGIDSPGLMAAAEALTPLGRVAVTAPTPFSMLASWADG